MHKKEISDLENTISFKFKDQSILKRSNQYPISIDADQLEAINGDKANYKGNVMWIVLTLIFLSYRIYSLRIIFFN